MRALLERSPQGCGTVALTIMRRHERPARAVALAAAASLHLLAAFILSFELSKTVAPKWIDGGGEAIEVVGFSQAEASSAMQPPARRDEKSKDELQDLLSAQSPESPRPPPPKNGTSTPLDKLMRSSADSTVNKVKIGVQTAAAAGSAKRMTTLKPGESLGNVDVVEAGSLPRVGAPPKASLPNLWRHIATCWRP